MSNQFIDKLFICVCVLFICLKVYCVYTIANNLINVDAIVFILFCFLLFVFIFNFIF
jgi:hypothetical protein